MSRIPSTSTLPACEYEGGSPLVPTSRRCNAPSPLELEMSISTNGSKAPRRRSIFNGRSKGEKVRPRSHPTFPNAEKTKSIFRPRAWSQPQSLPRPVVIKPRAGSFFSKSRPPAPSPPPPLKYIQVVESPPLMSPALPTPQLVTSVLSHSWHHRQSSSVSWHPSEAELDPPVPQSDRSLSHKLALAFGTSHSKDLDISSFHSVGIDVDSIVRLDGACDDTDINGHCTAIHPFALKVRTQSDLNGLGAKPDADRLSSAVASTGANPDDYTSARDYASAVTQAQTQAQVSARANGKSNAPRQVFSLARSISTDFWSDDMHHVANASASPDRGRERDADIIWVGRRWQSNGYTDAVRFWAAVHERYIYADEDIAGHHETLPPAAVAPVASSGPSRFWAAIQDRLSYNAEHDVEHFEIAPGKGSSGCSGSSNSSGSGERAGWIRGLKWPWGRRRS